MYEDTEAQRREEESFYGNWRPLPPKPREKAGYVEGSTPKSPGISQTRAGNPREAGIRFGSQFKGQFSRKEEYEDFRDILDRISLPYENAEPKAEAKPPGQDLKAVTSINTVSAQATFLPTQWKSCWGSTLAVLLALVGVCLLINIVLLSQHAATFSKPRKLNTSSVQGSCDVSAATLMINELTTTIVTKLKTLEKRIGETNKAIDNKAGEQISSIEGKLKELGTQIDTLIGRNVHWQKFQGSYYYFSESAKTWRKARDFCVTVNSYLVIIANKQEQDFVVSKMTEAVWLGLSDAAEEGQWRWVDGSPLVQSFWRLGEPNNIGGGEDCAVLLNESNWNDIACEKYVHFACEKTVICTLPQERKQ